MTHKPIERFMMRFLANQNSIAHNGAGCRSISRDSPTDCICLINSGPPSAFFIGVPRWRQSGRTYMLISRPSKYPPAEPGALSLGPLEAASGSLRGPDR